MRNLITSQEVIDLAFAENSNMREDSISETSIRIAEIKYIRPAFGAMYPLLADKYADFTNDYVKPALAYFVKCEIVSSIAIDMSNSGVAVANPQYQSAATDKQRQRLYDSEMSKAKTLLDFALEYIATHSEEFPDFSGEAPKKHHRVGGLLLGGGTSRNQSASVAGEAFKNEIERLSKDIADKVDKVAGKGLSTNDYTDADKALVQTIPNKQEKLTLTTKSNGNIVIGNLAGQTKEFMPATPSGDPMHYAYEVAGATWNANTEHWELNEIANITNSEMRELYNEAYLLATESLLTAWFNGSTQRTNICLCRWQARAAINTFGNCVNIEVATLGRQGFKASPTNLNYAFYPCKKLKKIITIIDCNNCTSFTAAFNGCYMLEEVRLEKLNKSISFAASPNLSTESILYMIENATATTAITITLHEDAYMRAQESEDIIQALDGKEKVRIASA